MRIRQIMVQSQPRQTDYDTLPQKNSLQKKDCVVVQSVDNEIKSQYHKKAPIE
jgi:hypothetical protein